jgi:hypothetical protein
MSAISPGPSAVGVTAMLAVTAVLLTVAVVASDEGERRMSGTLAQDATVEEVTEQRGRYIGERVVLGAQIDAIVAPRVLMLEGDPGNHLFVVTQRPVERLGGMGVSDGDRVTVTGTVTATDTVEVQRALEPGGGEPPVFHDAAAIVAKHIDVAPGGEGSR